MRVADYGPSRRADLADLLGRVWGDRPDEAELEWLYERNPVRPASVLLGEEDGRVVASVAIAFQRMAVGGRELEVGTAVGLATDPDHRGRGHFAALQAANEERARALGVRLLLTVPTPASARVLLGRLGWTALPPLRIWLRPRLLRPRLRARLVERFGEDAAARRAPGGGDRVLRDGAWLNWRFAEAPRPYALLERDGYAVVGRRGRLGVLAAASGDLLLDAAAAARGPALVAAPPPWERRRYARAGFLPTPRTLTLLGKALDGGPLPRRPHLELGDLDFT
ncbi:MAG TPA: GNAT family N-acetyltransferase [Gaiellaceae bacterium]|nr:GNAT family N-acetyltransferase [Gaiellaceae bacterium]